jgi:hypothetical protein
MATAMECGAVTTIGRGRPREARPSPLPLTLYDLITAVQDVVGAEGDWLVVATVRHLLRSGRLTGRGAAGVSRPRRGHAVTFLLPESRLKGTARSDQERSQSITGKGVKSRGRTFVGRQLGRGAGGAGSAGGSRPTSARGDRPEAALGLDWTANRPSAPTRHLGHLTLLGPSNNLTHADETWHVGFSMHRSGKGISGAGWAERDPYQHRRR